MAGGGRFAHVNRVALTREGWVFVTLVAGVLFGAVNTGNNLVYLVLGLLLACLVVANVLAEWNLRAIRVERCLPLELVAGQARSGSFVFHNGRGRGTAWQVEVVEQGPGRARALVPRCAADQSVFVPAAWIFPRRGLAPLKAVRIQSAFPFGWVTRWRDLPLEGEVLVFPGRSSRHSVPSWDGDGDDTADRGRLSDSGDFSGIRPWRPGDAVRRIHWPTSARVGVPMLVTRVAEGAEEIVLKIDPTLSGEAREEAILRVTTRAEAHLERGNRVGLEADGLHLPASSGSAWRRRLLTTLALLEHR